MLCRMTGKSQLSCRVNLQTIWCCQSERHSRHCASRCYIARRPSLDRRRGRVVLCSSAEGDPQSSGPDEATKLLEALQRQQTIGSEYGEVRSRQSDSMALLLVLLRMHLISYTEDSIVSLRYWEQSSTCLNLAQHCIYGVFVSSATFVYLLYKS